MIGLPAQSFEPNDLAIFQARSDRPAIRARERTDETPSFSELLEKASAKEPHTDRQNNERAEQTAVDRNRTEKKDDQPTPATPIRERRMENKEEIDQNPGTGTQAAAQTADTAATSEPQQASAVKAPVSDRAPKNDVEITASRINYGDDVKVSLHGLPEELLTALLLLLENGNESAQAVTFGTANQSVKSALDEGGLESLPDGSVKLTVKLATDPADPLKGVNEILSLIQALTEVLQKNAQQGAVTLHPGQAGTLTGDPSPSDTTQARQGVSAAFKDLFACLFLKEAPSDTTQARQGVSAAFKDLVLEVRREGALVTTNGPDVLDGLNVLPDGLAEPKLPQGTDLTESLLSKVKVTVSLPGVVAGANEKSVKGAEPPPQENGNSRFADQGTSMQATMQRQEPVAEGTKATSFGTLVADRLAAIAEQVALRDKPLDIMLRLKMEGGESLLVGLRDQAGKIFVNIRCADQNMVSLLESQKETIVRHLEAKQVSASISVSPIEQDLTKRQSREHAKNMWGRQRDPLNPYVEIQV
jgi:hypothetical protein